MAFFILSLLSLSIFSLDAQAKTEKPLSSFEFYLNIHQHARDDIPPPPKYTVIVKPKPSEKTKPEVETIPEVSQVEVVPEAKKVELVSEIPKPRVSPASQKKKTQQASQQIALLTTPKAESKTRATAEPAKTTTQDATASFEPEQMEFWSTDLPPPDKKAAEETLKPTSMPKYVNNLEYFQKNNIQPVGIIAIVIDDIGNHADLDSRVARLPGAVTLSVLPFTPHSKTVAELAYEQKKEVMLHAPMESEHHRKLGDGALTEQLDQQQFETVLQEDINSIPHITGVNNHMGSLLTQDKQAMDWVMQVVQKNNLFFLDSRTTPDSVAAKLAQEYNIPNVSRNVFLDNEQSYDYVDEAFKKTLHISKETGFAVAIGHPYPTTVSYLEKNLPYLSEQGYLLIPVSSLLTEKLARANARRQDNSLAKK